MNNINKHQLLKTSPDEREMSVELWSEMDNEARDEYLTNILKGKYSRDYDFQLIGHMSKGGSYESFAALVNVSIEALRSWEERYPSWYASKKIAFTKSILWWENVMNTTASGSVKGNASMIIFALKNKFPSLYSDSKQSSTEGTGGIIMVDTGIRRDNVVDAEFTEMDIRTNLI